MGYRGWSLLIKHDGYQLLAWRDSAVFGGAFFPQRRPWSGFLSFSAHADQRLVSGHANQRLVSGHADQGLRYKGVV